MDKKTKTFTRIICLVLAVAMVGTMAISFLMELL